MEQFDLFEDFIKTLERNKTRHVQFNKCFEHLFKIELILCIQNYALQAVLTTIHIGRIESQANVH